MYAMKISSVIFFLGLLALAAANCGCLKCSKHLKLVSPPCSKVQVVYRGNPCHCKKNLPYVVQAPVPEEEPVYVPKEYSYDIKVPYIPPAPKHEIVYHDCFVQAPVLPPEQKPVLLKPLKICADRIVLPAPECEYKPQYKQKKVCYYTNEKYVPKGPILEKLSLDDCDCRSVPQSRSKREIPILAHTANFLFNMLPPFIKVPIQKAKIQSNRAKVQSKITQNKAKASNKIAMKKHQKAINDLKKSLQRPVIVKESSIEKHSFNFLDNIKNPKRQKEMRTNRIPQIPTPPPVKIKRPLSYKEKAVLLEKLKKLNEARRRKRSIIIGSDELSLPFFEVKEPEVDENTIDSGSEEDDDEVVGSKRRKSRKYIESTEEEDSAEEESYRDRKKRILQKKLSAFKPKPLVPKTPLGMLVTAPITLIKHLKDVRETFSPLMEMGNEVMTGSKQYLKDFGKNFKSNILNLASNVVGDFDNVKTSRNMFGNLVRPRLRRALDEPKMNRTKRYILKVVDSREVQDFLKEKLGSLMYDDDKKPKKKKKKITKNPEIVGAQEDGGKKLVVEKLKPKIIIDNNGLPFMEINGVKRPMLMKKQHKEESGSSETKHGKLAKEDSTEMDEKINQLIEKAKEKAEKGESILKGRKVEMPRQSIKEKISTILTEIEDLINMDFEKYSDIYDHLLKLQNIKDSIVEDWRLTLMNDKVNDFNAKVALLEKFKEMNQKKEMTVRSIAQALKRDNKFMSKKLIKMLVRLQKLQCIISRVCEDFNEKIEIGGQFNLQKEIKYVDILHNLSFVLGTTRNENLNELKKERDTALEKEILLLESLRKLLEQDDCDLISDQASLIWELGNIDKLQKTTIEEMNQRLDKNLKIKKELKILFDLQKQVDSCQEEQKKLLVKIRNLCFKKIELQPKKPEDGGKKEESKSKPKNLNKKNLEIKKLLEENYKNYLDMTKKNQKLLREKYEKLNGK